MISRENKFWKFKFPSKNQSSTWRLQNYWKGFLILIVIALVLWVVFTYDYKTNSSYGLEVFKNNIKKLFIFQDQSTFRDGGNLWLKSLSYLWSNLKLAISGTFIGFIFALISSFLANKNFVNKYVAYIGISLIFVLRALPEIVFITLISRSLESAEAVLFLVYIWFSWLWLHKYFAELYKDIDLKFYFLSIQMGNTKIKSFTKEVWPKFKNKALSLFLFSFESNIRWSSLLSSLGLIGIGLLTEHATKGGGSKISELLIPLIVLVSFILFIELLNYVFSKYVFVHFSFKFSNKKKNKELLLKNWQKYLIVILVLSVVIFSIWTTSTLNYSFLKNNFFNAYLNNLFKPDYGVFSLNEFSIEKNPILQSFQTWAHAFFVFVIMCFFVFVILPFLVHSQQRKITVISFQTLIVIFRTVPVIVLFYIFSVLFNSTALVVLFLLGVHNSCSFLKQLSEYANNLNQTKINQLKLLGWNKRQIYFKHILPCLKIHIITLSTIYFEIIFKSVILYSFLSTTEFSLGGYMYSHLNAKSYNPNKAFAYMWLIVLNILILNTINYVIIRKIKFNTPLFNLDLLKRKSYFLFRKKF